jgi:lysophospholipase L1-like esterase
MTQRIRIFSLALVAAAGLAAAPAGAQADFTRYVSLGDSLTAGFASGGLAIDSQANSYPFLIHLQATGSSTFQQPTVSNPGIPAQLELVRLVPSVVIAAKPGAGQPTNLTLARPYDNLAVPGAKVRDTLSTVTGGLHDLVLRRIGTALQQAVALHPTFVTLWIGNNDALAAATSGLVIDGVTLTTAAQFEGDYRGLMGVLRQTGAKLALATIPNVTGIPFVTTIPPYIINPATQQPVLVNGQPVTYIGPGGHSLAPNDYVLLTAQTALGQGFGIPLQLGGNGQPLADQYVLSAAEAATITARVAQFNNTIRTIAHEQGAALFDAAAFFDEFGSGYEIGGLTFTNKFLTGGLFSFDGVHPSKFGYAVVANEFIKAINETHGNSIPELDLSPFFYSQGLPVSLTEADARSARLSSEAVRSLRESLGVPPINRLLKIKAGRATGVVVD